MKRRSFLQLIGGTALAGRKAAEHAVMRSIGMGSGVPVARSRPMFEGGAPLPASGSSGQIGEPIGYINSHQEKLVKASNVLRGLKVADLPIPDFIKEHCRDHAQYIHGLDPDIAIKCWSLMAKIQHQRQRNYERLLNEMTVVGGRITAKSAFEKLVGWNWPW